MSCSKCGNKRSFKIIRHKERTKFYFLRNTLLEADITMALMLYLCRIRIMLNACFGLRVFVTGRHLGVIIRRYLTHTTEHRRIGNAREEKTWNENKNKRTHGYQYINWLSKNLSADVQQLG